MGNRRWLWFVSAVLLVAIVVGCLECKTTAAQRPTGTDTDLVCEQLMADYILKRGKINSADIEAAIQLISSRGRGGYWRTVFKHFKESPVIDARSSPSAFLLTILTRMLATDGRARWLIAHPEERKASAWIPDIKLSADVLDAIISRARAADPNFLDAYLLAVVAAHDKRSKEFLLAVLHNQSADPADPFGAPPHQQPNHFYAAVGLANLGQREGLAWLVESPVGGSLWTYPHADVNSGDLLQVRLHALADLTGLPVHPLEAWQKWWKSNPIPGPFEPKSRVRLRLP